LTKILSYTELGGSNEKRFVPGHRGIERKTPEHAYTRFTTTEDPGGNVDSGRHGGVKVSR